MIDWRIWYRGGVVFDGDTDPATLPRDGCLGYAVLMDGPTDLPLPRRMSGSSDWYWYCEIDGEPTWCEGDRAEYPTEESVLARYPGAVVIRGQWTTDAEMHRLLEERMRIWRN